jgi:DNA polymerase elongation subunit (family B)
MEDKSEYYTSTEMISMVFSYNIKNGRAKEKVELTARKIEFQDFQHHKLPITMNPLEYGKLITQIANKFIIQINDTNIVIIDQFEGYNDVKLFRKGELMYEYRDNFINSNTFTRAISNKKYTFTNNELILIEIDKKVKFIEPLKSSTGLSNKFLTMDIETFLKDGVHVPYCICFYDGKNEFSYYLNYYKNSEDMIIACIKDLMVRKYDNHKIYVHNLSNFDANFLLKILANLGVVKPIIHHNSLISINFKYNGYDVTFRDSQQLLIRSLRELGKAFGVETQKSIFPYTFVNENTLTYNSHVPEFEYFNKVSIKDYQDYLNNFKFKT